MKQTFRAEGRKVFFSNEPIKTDDGTTILTLGGPLCEIDEYLEKPEEVAKWLADKLNIEEDEK